MMQGWRSSATSEVLLVHCVSKFSAAFSSSAAAEDRMWVQGAGIHLTTEF